MPTGIQPGDAASYTKTITEQDVRAFASLSGDTNSFHLDEEFARQTRFGRRIAHGMLTASLISTVIATKLPGPGAIYMSQTLKFLAPVFFDDTVTATVTVTALDQDRGRLTLATICTNQRGDQVLTGEALVLYPQSRS